MSARPEDVISKEEYEARALRIKEVEINALKMKGYDVTEMQDLLNEVKRVQKLYIATEELANSPTAQAQGYNFRRLLTMPALLTDLVNQANKLMGFSFFVSEASFKEKCGVSKATAYEILANIDAISEYETNIQVLNNKIDRKIMELPDPSAVFECEKEIKAERRSTLREFESSLDTYEKALDKILPEASALNLAK